MSLAVRLLFALGAVALFVTALVGLSAREVSRREVDRSFQQRIDAATRGARGEFVSEARTLAELLSPMCKHDSFVDRTLLDFQRVRGNVVKLVKERGIAIKWMVREQRKALRFDELLLVAGDGHIIGATELGVIGSRRPELAGMLNKKGGTTTLIWKQDEALLQVHCSRASGGYRLGLVATRSVTPILDRIGKAFGVALVLDAGKRPKPGPEMLVQKLKVNEIPGLELTASVSRQPKYEALAQIDSSIFLSGAIAMLLSVALAVFVARGLSQPIVELAAQTREVMRGTPKPVRGRGGRELKQLASTFNRAIDELTAMRKRLARTERIAARREVARQVAHEIKNPLAPIRAAVETLRRLRDRDSPQFDAYFDEATRTVLAEVHRIKKIVGEFTKFARMPPPKFERVDMVELAQGVVSLHDQLDDSQGPRVHLHSETIPQVMADPDQMVQVLTNLVQNGLEAAALVQDEPQVDVRLSRVGERELRIEVRDNGPGVDPSVRERLFEPYVSTKSEGTGLGLAIVQTILHEHGGEICCLDEGARATVFEITLPIDGPPLLEKAPGTTTGGGSDRDDA